MKKNAPGIHRKLIKVMAIQLTLISLVTILSVYGAAKVVENVLIKEALEGEARFFWEHYEKDNQFKLPQTLNLTGYIADTQKNDYTSVPEAISKMPIGYQRLESQTKKPLVHVSENFGKRLFLVFEEGQVSRLAFYFGIAPLAFVLLIIYLPAWISYMLSKRAISPVVKLSRLMEETTVSEHSDIRLNFTEIEKNADAEVLTLLDAFEQYAEQVELYVQRENNFTRYASHELRTPLAVLKGSISLLSKHDLSDKQQRIVSRMKPMVLEMEELLEALLLLSRNQEPKISEEPISINQLAQQQLDQIKKLFTDKAITTTLESKTRFNAKVPERLLTICINNILMNAFNYTRSGEIKVIINEDTLSVVDTGKGISEESLARIFEPFFRADRQSTEVKGFGLGLSIVKRICDQLGWDIKVSSEKGIGTKVSLTLIK
ncbi:MAG: HAMP domain-containing histidine kinase [Gammaproteobacteria bacterium]|nr:HAMP domain-containing histidine kinase [Gammaproteobacteria bacterium]